MGAFSSRQNSGVVEVDIQGNSAYRYPPKSGCYFGSYFIMGGERFDTAQPEAYLFGENTDLNFLGNRPVPFPYPTPQTNEPTKTLKSLVNIRKDSLRFVRVGCEEPLILTVDLDGKDEGASKLDESDGGSPSKTTGEEENVKDEDVPEVVVESKTSSVDSSRKNSQSCEQKPPATDSSNKNKYNIEFTFDCDVRIGITIYFFATEEFNNGCVTHVSRDSSLTSQTYYYNPGSNQVFSQPAYIFDPSLYTDDELSYSFDREVIPVVIQCVTEDKEKGVEDKQYHMTFGTIDKFIDGTYQLKPLKQKQIIDGLCYLLQEIYGIENKSLEYAKSSQEEELEENGSECVICMSDIRDTLILPCRHLCLCNTCADSLRYQANNCPICRAPFRALLQIRALRRKASFPLMSGDNVAVPGSGNVAGDDDSPTISQENVPTGFEAVSLVEALNGLAPSFNASNIQKRDSVDKLSVGEISTQSLEHDMSGGVGKKKDKKKIGGSLDSIGHLTPGSQDIMMTVVVNTNEDSDASTPSVKLHDHRSAEELGELPKHIPSPSKSMGSINNCSNASQVDVDAMEIISEMMSKFEAKKSNTKHISDEGEPSVIGDDLAATHSSQPPANNNKTVSDLERNEHRDSGDSFSSASSGSKLLPADGSENVEVKEEDNEHPLEEEM